MDVEVLRLENLKYKAKLLSDLNLRSEPVFKSTRHDASTKQATKKRRLDLDNTATRTSARIASSTLKPIYSESRDERVKLLEPKRGKKQARRSKIVQPEPSSEQKTLIPAKDVEEIRAGWTKWTVVAESPTRDGNGTFRFENFPNFTPNKSPEEMIREGCFGGSYFRPLKSKKLGILMENDWSELPEAWYGGLHIDKYLAGPQYDPEVNKFKVACGQSIEEWEASGWISYKHDIRGWFQWYCRFFMGRRCIDDERQISRWRKCVGETGRWRRMLLKKYVQMGVRDVFDDGEEEDQEVSPVMHQTCHHWAYQVRQEDLDSAWRGSRR